MDIKDYKTPEEVRSMLKILDNIFPYWGKASCEELDKMRIEFAEKDEFEQAGIIKEFRAKKIKILGELKDIELNIKVKS